MRVDAGANIANGGGYDDEPRNGRLQRPVPGLGVWIDQTDKFVSLDGDRSCKELRRALPCQRPTRGQ
jgi:hypothetical protein